MSQYANYIHDNKIRQRSMKKMTKEERKEIEKDLARKFLALTEDEQNIIHEKMKELWEAKQAGKKGV